jgi:hypothetical protein
MDAIHNIYTPNELSPKTTGSKSSRKAMALPAIKTLYMKKSRLYLSSNNVLIQGLGPSYLLVPKAVFRMHILGKRIGRDGLP